MSSRLTRNFALASQENGLLDADLYDEISVALPDATPFNVDGEALSDGDKVLFTNLEKIYQASIDGGNITWALIEDIVLDEQKVLIDRGGTYEDTIVQIKDGVWQVSLTDTDTDTGEDNDGLNVGGGNEVFKDKAGVDLRFRTLVAAGGAGIVQNADTIEISAPVPGGSITILDGAVDDLNGDYDGDVLVINNAISMTGNVNIAGSLYLEQGINDGNGKTLNVFGSIYNATTFNSRSIDMSGLSGSPDAGSVFVGGNCYAISFSLNGYNTESGDAGSFECIGSVYNGSINCNGGTGGAGGGGITNGGNGGNVTISGNSYPSFIFSNGGNSAAGGAGGDAGTIEILGNASGTIGADGGSGDGFNGGDAGDIEIEGDYNFSTANARGGFCENANGGFGGSGGNITIFGNCARSSLNSSGGDGVDPTLAIDINGGNAGFISLRGACQIDTLRAEGGFGATNGNGGNGGPITLESFCKINTLSSNGGGSDNANAGRAGNITVNSGLTASTVTMLDGVAPTDSGGAAIFRLTGRCDIKTLDVSNLANYHVAASVAHAVLFVGLLATKNVLIDSTLTTPTAAIVNPEQKFFRSYNGNPWRVTNDDGVA